jgi:hypothetical protein
MSLPISEAAMLTNSALQNSPVSGGGYMSYEEEDTCHMSGGYMSYEEEEVHRRQDL